MFRFLFLSLAVAIVFCGGEESRAADKPNIVYIMMDEWGCFESSGMGHPILQTPNIDRMAAHPRLSNSSVISRTSLVLVLR